MRGFIDDARTTPRARPSWTRLNPRSCAASSMTADGVFQSVASASLSQSAFMRGFIDDFRGKKYRSGAPAMSQSAFMRGFIDDINDVTIARGEGRESQSAFMRGFIDDLCREAVAAWCEGMSQSAFMRGFIDDDFPSHDANAPCGVSIRVHARLHR